MLYSLVLYGQTGPQDWPSLRYNYLLEWAEYHFLTSSYIIGQQCLLLSGGVSLSLIDNPAVTLEAAIVGSYSTLRNLIFRGPKAHPEMTSLMRTTVQVWHRAGAKYCDSESFSPHIPLWGNPCLPHINTIPDPSVWASWGIVGLKCGGGRLKAAFHLPNWMFFFFF